MVLPTVDAVVKPAVRTLSALLVLMPVPRVALLGAVAPTCPTIARSRTASEREVCGCGMIDLRIRKTASHSNTAETYAHVGLPHVPVAAHCAAASSAAGQQGCSVGCVWGSPRSLLCCCIEL